MTTNIENIIMMKHRTTSSQTSANAGQVLRMQPLQQHVHRHGFTLLELMITVGIIALLISMVIVGGGHVRQLADARKTGQILVSVKTGIQQFEKSFGYYPPLLVDEKSETEFMSVPIDEDARKDQGFYSTMNLVPYLTGIGDINLDGNPEPDTGKESDDNYHDDGQPGEGFRDPGEDRSWGGAYKALDREVYWERYIEFDSNASRRNDRKPRGNVTKRLIELNDQIKRAVDRQGIAVEEFYLFQMNDIWDRPIRYYTGWDHTEEEVDSETGWPDEWPREWYQSTPKEEHDSLTSTLRSAPFVLLSSGRDQRAMGTDDEEFEGDEPTEENDLDNLMEIGE